MGQFESRDNFDNIINAASKKLGADRSVLENAAKSGDVQSLLGKMSNEQKQKLQSVLSDKEKTEKILNSPQAQAIIKKLMRSNGN